MESRWGTATSVTWTTEGFQDDNSALKFEGSSASGVGYPPGVIQIFTHLYRQRRFYQQLTLLIAGALLLTPQSSSAQEPEDPESPFERRVEAVNDFHGRVGERIFQLSERVDDFFGDRRMEDEPVETKLRVRTKFNLQEGGKPDVKFKIRANAILPRTEHRFGIFVESLREDFLTDFGQVLGDESSEASPDNPLADDNVSGIRFSLFRNFPGRWTFDGGVKISSDPKTRVRLRWQYDWQAFEKWNMRVIQSLEYREELGAGVRTQLRWERLISERLLRFTLEGVQFADDSPESIFAIDHYIPLNEDSTIRITASEFGFLGSGAELDGSSLEVAWRRKVLYEWLYIELAPRMFWADIPSEDQGFSTFLAFEVVFVN
ncbi:MAG: hypothetical protein CBC13_07815 [Planctomycetia bacterium TMED53]|nr:MAG: hypothetical protein CBC13_07815 [Planctomycetia bacterium TMED53]